MVLNSVVLPAPLGPTIATRSPDSTRIVTEFSTGTPPYPAHKPRISSMGDSPPLAEVGVDHRGIPGDVRRLPRGQHRAVVEHDEPVHQTDHGLHGVLDDDDRDA